MANSNISKIETITNELEKRSVELIELNVVTKNLENLTRTTTDSNNVIKNEAKKLDEFVVGASEKIKKVEKSVEKIDNISFPTRLDKIDASVSGVYQGIQNLQMKLENIDRNIKEYLEKENRKMDLKINHSNNLTVGLIAIQIIGFLFIIINMFL